MDSEKPLYLVIPAERRKLVANIYNDISFHLERKEPVPYDLVHTFISCIFSKEHYEEKNDWIKAGEIAKKALARMESVKGYDFKWKTVTVRTKEKEIKYPNDSEKKLCECLYRYFFNKEKYPTKEDAVEIFYDTILGEHFTQPIKSHLKRITEYKRMVIAGILTISVGFKITSKKNPNNEEIYQAVRNALKKKKP